MCTMQSDGAYNCIKSHKTPQQAKHTIPVIHLQFWAYGSLDSLFPILMSPTANLRVQNTIFNDSIAYNTIACWDSLK